MKTRLGHMLTAAAMAFGGASATLAMTLVAFASSEAGSEAAFSASMALVAVASEEQGAPSMV